MSGIIGLSNNVGTGRIGPPSGTLLQCIVTEVTTQQSSAQTTFNSSSHLSDYDTTITPHFSTSKLIITASGDNYNGTNNGHTYFTIFRDSQNLGHSTHGLKLNSSGNSSGGHWNNIFFIALDGGQTGQVTYKLYVRVGSGTGYFNYQAGAPTYMMVQEIAV